MSKELQDLIDMNHYDLARACLTYKTNISILEENRRQETKRADGNAKAHDRVFKENEELKAEIERLREENGEWVWVSGEQRAKLKQCHALMREAAEYIHSDRCGGECHPLHARLQAAAGGE